MKLMIFYAIGYVIAAVWTAVWVLREEVEESKAFRLGFAVVMGFLSWTLVVIYLMAWSEGRRKNGKH